MEVFAECRPLLASVAGRILGSELEVEDMLQEASLRWEAADAGQVQSPRAFLITIVTRLCLNQIKLARVRLHDAERSEELESVPAPGRGPDELAELADALTEGFSRLLTRLSATERAVFLLREAFDFKFEEIAPVVGRGEANCRQILKRARERLAREAGPETPGRPGRGRMVELFREAVQTGDMKALLRELSAGAVLVQDGGDLRRAAPEPLAGPGLLEELLRQRGRLRELGATLSAGQVLGRPAVLARRGRQTVGAFLLDAGPGGIRRIRLVRCPALLKTLGLLMKYNNTKTNNDADNNKN